MIQVICFTVYLVVFFVHVYCVVQFSFLYGLVQFSTVWCSLIQFGKICYSYEQGGGGGVNLTFSGKIGLEGFNEKPHHGGIFVKFWSLYSLRLLRRPRS